MYRKTSNGKSYYKITATDRLTEIQIIGSNYLIHQLKAELYPEKVFIHELIENKEERYINIDEAEFDNVLHHCQNHLKPIA